MPRSAVELVGRPHLSAAELLERGLRFRPRLVTRQVEAERLRRLPEATRQEFHDAGILRAIQPAAFGGFEADFICQIDLTYEIARACGASGWVYAVLSAHAAMIANFSELAQQEVWGNDPCALASSSLSSIGRFRRVDGGYVVSGFWRYSSGCDYCAWLVAGADAEAPDETGRRSRRRFLLIPALEIVDDWHILGLAGTGSKSLRGEDVFVPRWQSLTDREFLELAVNDHADVLITGDRDLLALNPFRGVPTITPPPTSCRTTCGKITGAIPRSRQRDNGPGCA